MTRPSPARVVKVAERIAAAKCGPVEFTTWDDNAGWHISITWAEIQSLARFALAHEKGK